MSKRIVYFFVIFSISTIMTYPALPVSHALDSYCTICNGYHNTAIWFLQNGRVISYLFYNLFDFMKLSYNLLGIISVLLGNVILTFCILILYKELENNFHIKNKLYELLVLLLLFLLFFNPLYTSILLLDEAFIIDLGILLLTLSNIYLFKNSLKSYFLSLLFVVLGIMCYQGIASYLVLVLLILIISDKSKNEDINFFLKNMGLVILNYGIAFVINFIIIKIVSIILGQSMPSLGGVNIIYNLNKIFTIFVPSSLRYLFGYINTRYYYGIVLLLLIISIIRVIKNKSDHVFMLVLLLFCCVFVPFIPNIFMSSAHNYTNARMTLTMGVMPVVIIIYLLCYFKLERKYLYFFCGITLCFFIITFKSIHHNMMIDLKRYASDVKYIHQLVSDIHYYELDNHTKINTIYYAFDKRHDYYYDFGNANEANVRLNSEVWALECALKSSLNRKILFERMSDYKLINYFNGVNYDEFNKKQLVYEENIVYLLLY